MNPAFSASQDPAVRPSPPRSADAARDELKTATLELGSLLDESWRRYFSLPTEIFRGSGHPTAASLDQPIARFERVASDPRYQILIDRSEFQRVRRLLQQYQHELQTLSSSTDHSLSAPSFGDRTPASATVR